MTYLSLVLTVTPDSDGGPQHVHYSVFESLTSKSSGKPVLTESFEIDPKDERLIQDAQGWTLDVTGAVYRHLMMNFDVKRPHPAPHTSTTT